MTTGTPRPSVQQPSGHPPTAAPPAVAQPAAVPGAEATARPEAARPEAARPEAAPCGYGPRGDADGGAEPGDAGDASPADAWQGSAGPSRAASQDAPAGPLWRRMGRPVVVLGAVVGAFAYVGVVDPNRPGHYPACPLLALTGVYCPGCGGLRSAHAFAHGDLVTALHANAPAVVGYLLFAVAWTVWAVRAARGRPARFTVRPAHLWAFGTVLAVFTLVRNLPFGGWLHP